jgi:hypothetical protein
MAFESTLVIGPSSLFQEQESKGQSLPDEMKLRKAKVENAREY